MNKRIVAVLLTGAVLGSQFMGTAETLAANIPGDNGIAVNSTDEENQERESSEEGQGVHTQTSGGSQQQTGEGVKATLINDSTVIVRDSENNSGSGTVIPDDQLNTITDLLVGETATTVPAGKFQGMENLIKLTFAGANSNTSLKTIGANAFQGTGILQVELPTALTSIGASAFKDTTALTEVNFSASTKLTTIHASAFENSGITGAALPAALTSIGNSAFKETPAFATVNFPASSKLTSIGASAFEGSGLTGRLDLSTVGAAQGSSIEIGEKAFMNSEGITSVTLPEKMTQLKSQMFQGTSLTTIEINKDCIIVVPSALPDTLTSITVKPANTSFKAENGALYNFAKKSLIAYPGGKTGDVTFPATITSIGSSAFENNSTIIKVTLPSGLTDIGINAFKGSSKLEEVDLGNNPDLANIEAAAFEGTTALTVMDLRKATKLGKIGDNAFKGSALDSIYIGEATKKFTFGVNAFQTTATNKKVYFLDNNGAHIKGEALTGLKTKWNELTGVNQGSWIFYTQYPAPEAIANYETMKLQGLEASAEYKVTIEEASAPEPVVLTADARGEIDISPAWSGKMIEIIRMATETNDASIPQSLSIDRVYTVTVDGRVHTTGKTGKSVTVMAQDKTGYVFTGWETSGVTFPNPSLKEVTFTIGTSDITLTTTYTPIITTKPEDMKFDGTKEVNIEFLKPSTEFQSITIDGKTLTKGTDYTIAAASAASMISAKTVVTLKKAYLNTLQEGANAFQVVFTSGSVDFSIQVVKTPEEPPVNPSPEETPDTKPDVPAKPAVTFPDVKEDDWFFTPVSYVSSRDLMTGYSNGTFGPSDVLGRAQFATILYRIGGSKPTEYKDLFSDVPAGQFYSESVVWAKENDIITGYANGTFGPSDSITREQLVTIMYRYAVKMGADVSIKGDISKFPDEGEVSSFAREAVAWAVGSGIISGDQGNLNPQGTSSRAVAATVIQRFDEKY